MNTKNIPTIIMLVAGLVASIVTYINHYEMKDMLWSILVVFLVFYILGCIVKVVLDRWCVPKKEEEEDSKDTGEEKEPENEDGSVIEKK